MDNDSNSSKNQNTTERKPRIKNKKNKKIN